MRIGIWGDSIVNGLDDFSGGGWATRLKIHYWTESQYRGPSVYVLGIGSETASGLLKRFDTEYEARKPDVVIFGVGTNDAKYKDGHDYMTQPEDFVRDLKILVTKAQSFEAKVVCLGTLPVVNKKLQPCPWGDGTWGYDIDRAKEFDRLIEQVSNELDVSYLSMWDVVSEDDLENDGLHPNSNGHQKMFERVRNFLVDGNLV